MELNQATKQKYIELLKRTKERLAEKKSKAKFSFLEEIEKLKEKMQNER